MLALLEDTTLRCWGSRRAQPFDRHISQLALRLENISLSHRLAVEYQN